MGSAAGAAGAGSAKAANGARASAEVRMVAAKNFFNILFPFDNRSARCGRDVLVGGETLSELKKVVARSIPKLNSAASRPVFS